MTEIYWKLGLMQIGGYFFAIALIAGILGTITFITSVICYATDTLEKVLLKESMYWTYYYMYHIFFLF